MKSIFALVSIFLVSSIFIQAQTFDKIWETDRVLKTPESVCFDAERNQIYVSNINGKPTDKDGNGFISLLGRDGTIKKLEWVKGMHAPKGMVIIQNLLFVTDIDRYHIIDIERAEIVRTVDVEGALFLNDMAADPLGNVFISDMANNHVLYVKNSKVEVWLEGEEIIKPNGLFFLKGFLYVGVKDNLLKVHQADKSVKVLITETGSIDGLVYLTGNKFVISDWSGRIMRVSPTEKFVLSNTTEDNVQAADLGYIAEEKLILIPTFFDNRVVARKLP